MSETPDTAIDECIAQERDLHLPATRASAERLDALLDPDFREISISGRLWLRQPTIDALCSNPQPVFQPPLEDSEMEGKRIANHLVLLTYVSGAGRRRARRTSLWRLNGEEWRLLHHQGTHLP